MGKIKHQTINNRTDFFYYAFRNILLVSLPILVVSALILSHSFSRVSADNPNNSSGSSTDSLTFSISSSCTLSSVVDSNHNAELNNGTYVDGIGKTTITTLCNDGNGYSIYAVGYSNNEEGNNQLVNSVNSSFNIDTGLATSGLVSNWSMSLNNVVNDISPTPPEIEDDYDGVYGLVPNEWTKVASLPSRSTDMVKGSSFTTTYAVYTSSSQNAGTYNGQVKYMLVHPSYLPAIRFMQDVADWKDMVLRDIGDSVQAIDKRDGKAYWVTKLADGNIWMTQNLDLCIGCEGVAALTSENTDISINPSVYESSGIYSDYTLSNGVYTWIPDTTAITSGKIIDYNNNSVSNWTTSSTAPVSVEGGDTYYYASEDNNSTRYTSLTDCITVGGHSELECKKYSAGNYYNWTAAIASNDSTNIDSSASNVADNSICPKGWRLPNANENDFGKLFYEAQIIDNEDSINYLENGFNKLSSNPYYFTQSGRIIQGGGLYDSETQGYYWYSTPSATGAFYMFFNKSHIYPAISSYYDYRYYGRSLRCIARNN